MANLSLKHIYKVYPNGVKAVSDFNMEIEDKEFIVFVGPSGCGKSTTLRMIAGLEDITAGELTIGDTVVNDVEPKDRDIAMVFQNYALYPHMTVFENIAFGLRLRKLPKEEINKRVLEAAEILGITEYLGRKPKEMSGGQRQRVSLGRAIVREPKVMLLDEPLSNLDAKLRTAMRSEISKLHKRLNTTFIYVTHDQIEAMTMGTRIVVMKEGFVQQIDTPKNLYHYPINKFVAGFIGTPQMNFFEGTLTRKGDVVEIAFFGTDARISVPYTYFYKTRPDYLTGEKTVTIGLRAEDISLDPEVVSKSAAVVKVKVSHKEELGNETLIYGDISMEGDGFTESNTRVIIKSYEDVALTPGETVNAALDLDKVHLFDKETEVSILPRIPEFNYLDCEARGGVLTFLGQTFRLPPAIHLDDGNYQLLIPTDAFRLGGDIGLACVETEVVGGKTLCSFELGGRRLFALLEGVHAGEQVRLSFDPKRISVLRGTEEVVSPLPSVASFDGMLKKVREVREVEKKGKIKRKKVVEFRLAIENALFNAPEKISDKLITVLSVHRAFTSKLRFECSPYDITFAQEGVSATVEEFLDYGTERFVRCNVGGKSVVVATAEPVEGEVHLVPDLDKLAVIQSDLDIRII